MENPILASPPSSRQTVDTFYGYDHNLRIRDGRFYEMENMTSDSFPVLSPRGKRGVYIQNAQPRAMVDKGGLCYIDGPHLYINSQKVDGLTLADSCVDCPHREQCHHYEPGRTQCNKQMITMGGYIFIFPDKVWVQPGQPVHFGSMEHYWQNQGWTLSVGPCRADGSGYGTIPTQPPENPTPGQVWQDGQTLREWVDGAWTAVQTPYIRIYCHGHDISKGFNQYDGIEISGLPGCEGSAVVWKTAENTLIIPGSVSKAYNTDQPITISRRLPAMDFVVSCGNRLWGCRYGKDNVGTFVNEIYCSKLGDFMNFSCYMGISTDSGVLNLGSDGPFTGAIAYLDHPIFFKENMLHKVYISDRGAHSVSDTPCRGVQAGCDKSLAIVEETLYYKSQNGVCAYDGSLPVCLSRELGTDHFEQAVAGGLGSKYYISMQDSRGSHLFVYDTARKLWHREDSLPVVQFCAVGRELYAISGDKIWALMGTQGQTEDPVQWSVQTGPMGLNTPDSKYLSRLTVRLLPEKGAQVRLFVRYDFDDAWQMLCQLTGQGLRSFLIPIRPKRCDTMALRIEGEGDCKIYSFTKTLEKGSDVP